MTEIPTYLGWNARSNYDPTRPIHSGPEFVSMKWPGTYSVQDTERRLKLRLVFSYRENTISGILQ